MNLPLASVALLYVGGILLGRYVPASHMQLLVLALAVGSTAVAVEKWRRWLLALTLVLTGWVNLLLQTNVLSRHDLRAVFSEKPAYVTLRGTLAEAPTFRVYDHGAEQTWRTIARLEVAAVQPDKESWQLITGTVLISTPDVLDTNFHAGSPVEVIGVLRPPTAATAEGLFDYRAHLNWQGIHYQLQVRSTNDWQLLQATPPPLSDRFLGWAKDVLARGLPVVDEPLRLLWAMTLGWKTALTDEVSEPFMRSGTMHIFAISGLHIALIAGILVSVLRVLQIPRAACGVVVIPLIWFYTAATGWQASAIRSTIMMTVIIAGWALRRPSNLLNSLAASGFIILMWQPQQLFQASFQLSFFVVLSIALLLPPLEKLRLRLLQTDPFLPDELRPRWQRWLDLPVRFVTTSFATSLAAWLGSMPLIALYFHLATPGSLFANLLVVPLSSLALMCNLGSLVCGNWLPWGTELFNHSAWLWMRLMVLASEWTTTLPAAYWYVRSPTLLEIAMYYALLWLVISGWWRLPTRRVATIAIVAVLAAALTVSWAREPKETRITVLNGAASIFINEPGAGNDLLVDCGGEAETRFLVKPLLHAAGINRLPRLLLTHGDLHHVGGAEAIAGEFKPEEVVTSAIRFRSTAYRQAVEKLEQSSQRLRQIKRGDALGHWQVLHPEAQEKFTQADDSAVVLRGEVEGVRMLLLSDLGRLGQRAVLERYADLRADIVVAGIPAQGEPLSGALLEAIQPRVIIVQDRHFPAAKHASRPLRERLSEGKTIVLYTSDVGSLVIAFSHRGWEVHDVAGKIIASGSRWR
jgi:competence protein ComEC